MADALEGLRRTGRSTPSSPTTTAPASSPLLVLELHAQLQDREGLLDRQHQPEPSQRQQPRWPLVIAELDEEKLALRKNTVTIIDDHGPNDGADLQLSNMSNIEDPQSGRIIVILDVRAATRTGSRST